MPILSYTSLVPSLTRGKVLFLAGYEAKGIPASVHI